MKALVALPMFFATLPAGNKLPEIVKSVLEKTATLPMPATDTVTLAPELAIDTFDDPLKMLALPPPPPPDIPVSKEPLPIK